MKVKHWYARSNEDPVYSVLGVRIRRPPYSVLGVRGTLIVYCVQEAFNTMCWVKGGPRTLCQDKVTKTGNIIGHRVGSLNLRGVMTKSIPYRITSVMRTLYTMPGIIRTKWVVHPIPF